MSKRAFLSTPVSQASAAPKRRVRVEKNSESTIASALAVLEGAENLRRMCEQAQEQLAEGIEKLKHAAKLIQTLSGENEQLRSEIHGRAK